MAGWFTVDDTIDSSAFASWNDVAAFLAAESTFWGQIDTEKLSRGARSVVEKTLAVLATAQRNQQSWRVNGQPHVAGVNFIISKLDAEERSGLSSRALASSTYRDILEAESQSAALFNLGFRHGVVTLAEARDPSDLIGALWEVAPGLNRTAELAKRLAQERENARHLIRNEKARARREDEIRMDEWEAKLQTAYSAYVGWARRRSTRWGQLTRSWEERHRESERRIRAIEATYKEHMGLKAPVEYWTEKAKAHGRSEKLLRSLVVAFFIVAMGAIIWAFWTVGWGLINLAVQPGAKPLPTGVYVVASAGLASSAAIIFWAGRLLTKLYLSQHHLRQDAEERATMTQTYLALIENQAAEPEDKQVILNALFRATPDGIVKEEGGLDPSIAAALGKYLAK